MIIQSEHNNFKVKLELEDYKESEVPIIEGAVHYMALAMGDPSFETFCREHEYEVEKSSGWWFWRRTWKEKNVGFHMSQGLTGFQIYTRLMEGKEMEPEETYDDYEADIYLRIDRKNKPGVIGYTYPTTKWQWIYQRIVDTWGIEDVAGNLAHEWCHKMGFEHESNWTEERRYSVPYAVGYWVRDFIKAKQI